MAFLDDAGLKKLGLKKYGKKVLISDKASIYGAENISIGDNVRIDDFCVLSAVGGFIELHSHIHIAVFSSLFGGGGILMESFSGTSSYVSIYSLSDTFNGNYLVGPIMDKEFTNVTKSKTVIGRYATCATHSVVLPGASLGEGSILGAQSLANKPLESWKIYAGAPARFIKEREKGLIEKSREMELNWEKF